MSPLIHRSLTWSIVGAVVVTSAWLAGNVQDAHERRGPPRLGSVSASPAVRPAMPAPHPATMNATAETQPPVTLTAGKH